MGGYVWGEGPPQRNKVPYPKDEGLLRTKGLGSNTPGGWRITKLINSQKTDNNNSLIKINNKLTI